MSFKDLIKKDVQKIFMNPDEFSEIHNINGKDMPIQIDANEQIEREKRQNQNSSGIYVNQKLVVEHIIHQLAFLLADDEGDRGFRVIGRSV